MRSERKQGRAPAQRRHRAPIIEHPDVRRMLLTMRALTRAARAICYATGAAIDRAHRGKDEAARKAGARARLAADAGRQGVLDRHRHRGRLARRAGAWRHGLHRGDRRRAALSRRAHRADLRRHQRHPGDRSRHAQAAAGRRRGGARLSRRAAQHRRGGEGRRTIRPSARPARGLREAVDSLDRATDVAARHARHDRRTRRSPARRPICGCSPPRPAAACWPRRRSRHRAAAAPTAARRVALARFFAENIAVQAGGLETTVTEGAGFDRRHRAARRGRLRTSHDRPSHRHRRRRRPHHPDEPAGEEERAHLARCTTRWRRRSRPRADRRRSAAC